MKIITSHSSNFPKEWLTHQTIPIPSGRGDDMLDLLYEGLDDHHWYATDHRDMTGEELIEATRRNGKEYFSARIVHEEDDIEPTWFSGTTNEEGEVYGG